VPANSFQHFTDMASADRWWCVRVCVFVCLYVFVYVYGVTHIGTVNLGYACVAYLLGPRQKTGRAVVSDGDITQLH